MGDMLRFDAERLRILIERHLLLHRQRAAGEILDELGRGARPQFVKVMPNDYRARARRRSPPKQTAAAVAAE